MMTDLENFRATVEHRKPGRIFYAAGFTEDLLRRVKEHAGTDDLARHYGYFEPPYVGPKRPANLPKLDFSKYWQGQDLPPGTTINDSGVAMVPSGFYHFWGYISPLRNATDLKEIETYPLEDMRKWDFSGMAEEVAAYHAKGKVVVGWVGHMYENAWQIRGYEPFLMDMMDRPEWAQCLLDRIAEQARIRAVAFAKAGVDIIRCGDDVANQNALMFQPDQWRRMMHSRWAATWKEVKSISSRSMIWYHSDGNILDIVGDLVDAGLDILNPLQPECLDIDAVHRRFGKHLSFDGCMGTQSTMPFGTPDAVRARVKEIIDKYGRNGGLFISPTHVLEPEVPLANIDAFAEACRQYGTFE